MTDTPPYQSTSHPIKPMSYDRMYYFLPYWDNKPCLHVRSVWHDHRRRLYHSNLLARIAEKLVSDRSRSRSRSWSRRRS